MSKMVPVSLKTEKAKEKKKKKEEEKTPRKIKKKNNKKAQQNKQANTNPRHTLLGISLLRNPKVCHFNEH